MTSKELKTKTHNANVSAVKMAELDKQVIKKNIKTKGKSDGNHAGEHLIKLNDRKNTYIFGKTKEIAESTLNLINNRPKY